MAPSGRAAMILGAKTEKTAFTIHKTIYDFDKLRDDDHTFRFKYDLKINEDSIDTVYIVDESSMISDFTNEQEFIGFGSGRLLKDIVDHISFSYKPDTKIIFTAEIEDYDGEVHHIKCKIILDFLKSRHRSLTQDQQQALYVDYKQRHAGLNPDSAEFKEALRNDKYFNALQVKYDYAITCHKAQGGEWENVFVILMLTCAPSHVIILDGHIPPLHVLKQHFMQFHQRKLIR